MMVDILYIDVTPSDIMYLPVSIAIYEQVMDSVVLALG